MESRAEPEYGARDDAAARLALNTNNFQLQLSGSGIEERTRRVDTRAIYVTGASGSLLRLAKIRDIKMPSS